MKRLSLWLLSLSAVLMPAAQSEWARAMNAEWHAIQGRCAQLRFAAGCLHAAFDMFSRTRFGLSVIGRGIICAALAAICTYGAHLLKQLSTPEAAPFIATLILIYAAAGGLCALSLRGMRVYCAVATGALLALAIGFYLRGFSYMSLGTPFFLALALEAAVILFGLFLAACFLQRVHPCEA